MWNCSSKLAHPSYHIHPVAGGHRVHDVAVAWNTSHVDAGLPSTVRWSRHPRKSNSRRGF